VDDLRLTDSELAAVRATLDQLVETVGASAGPPDGIGVDHLPLRRLGRNAPVADTFATVTTPDERRRLLAGPLRDVDEICARTFAIKEAAAKALGGGPTGQLDWRDLRLPTLGARPLVVDAPTLPDRRLHAASARVAGLALAVVAAHRA
jgi:phosphopantetheinyl transferase (holo-ACP synthase)